MAQRFGFADPDLTTPTHDAILLWLDENIGTIVRAELGELDGVQEIRSLNSGKMLTDLKPEEQEDIRLYPMGATIFEIKARWECPILDRSYTIGFCDMLVSITRTRENGCVYRKYDPTVGRDVFLPGKVSETVHWWMEIKPKIPSLGELIRQLRMYQSYTEREDRWFVVSPDTRWRSQIESQGFGFIESP